jgi:tRNA pseudouridine32 synthase/23S rRNA pseudouridine746 synthase
VLLKAFSGQLTEEWQVPGWVGPVAGITAACQQYAGYRQLTEQLSARIQAMQAAIQRHQQARQAGAGAGPGPRGGSPAFEEEAQGGANGGRQQRQGRRQQRQQQQQQRARQQLDPALAALQRQQALLAARRKALSHELLLRIQGSYHTRDLKDRRLQLLEVYARHCALTGAQPNCLAAGGWALHQARLVGRKAAAAGSQEQGSAAAAANAAAAPAPGAQQVVSFPAGTGDCCAPKLIHAALQAGLRPLGMVELWYGAPPGARLLAPAGAAGAAGACSRSCRLVCAPHGTWLSR